MDRNEGSIFAYSRGHESRESIRGFGRWTRLQFTLCSRRTLSNIYYHKSWSKRHPISGEVNKHTWLSFYHLHDIPNAHIKFDNNQLSSFGAYLLNKNRRQTA